MKLTRKQFLGTIATGLVGTALPGVLKGASAKKSPSSADFQGLVGNSFQFRSAKGNSSQLVLHQFENKASSKGTSQFSLSFTGSSGPRLAEGIYDVQHSSLGTFQMFIIPTGSDGSYRADFNLLG